jgi:hypothetical protein
VHLPKISNSSCGHGNAKGFSAAIPGPDARTQGEATAPPRLFLVPCPNAHLDTSGSERVSPCLRPRGAGGAPATNLSLCWGNEPVTLLGNEPVTLLGNEPVTPLGAGKARAQFEPVTLSGEEPTAVNLSPSGVSSCRVSPCRVSTAPCSLRQWTCRPVTCRMPRFLQQRTCHSVAHVSNAQVPTATNLSLCCSATATNLSLCCSAYSSEPPRSRGDTLIRIPKLFIRLGSDPRKSLRPGW